MVLALERELSLRLPMQKRAKAIEDLMINHVGGAAAANRIVLEESMIGVEASCTLSRTARIMCDAPHATINESARMILDQTRGHGNITDPHSSNGRS
jgi:hypothetical protein